MSQNILHIANATARPQSPHPILNLGFRIFFVGAAIFAVLTMAAWAGVLFGKMPFYAPINPFYWHGHEMVFGYALAVIAGFLLTAVKTWTSQPMPYGYKLAMIFAPWVVARLLWMGAHAMTGTALLMAAFVFDVLFWGLTCFYVIAAIVRVRQKRQIGIVAKLILLLVAQLIFYAGVAIHNQAWQSVGLYLAFYVIIAVVLTIGRRVLPFFIEKGVAIGRDGKPDASIHYVQKNSVWLDRLSLCALLLFLVGAVFYPNKWLILGSALGVAGANAVRLIYCYHGGIWQKPLLWSLYGSFWGLVAGFVLFAFYPWLGVSQALAMHMIALSGVGLTTISMMARVSLGHTGRNIHKPPHLVWAMFGLMGVAIVFRVIMPLFDDNAASYMTYMAIAQIAWIVAFALFCVAYVKILSSQRPDGLFG